MNKAELYNRVFPLSPSNLLWEVSRGCYYKRPMQKVLGLREIMPERVFLGRLVDDAVTEYIKRILRKEEVTNYDFLMEVITRTYDEKKGEHEECDRSIRDRALTIAMHVSSSHRINTAKIIAVQPYLRLRFDYCGRPTSEHYEPGTPGWAHGFADWVELLDDGTLGVFDLKVSARPKKGSNVENYKTPLYFYAAAIEEDPDFIDEGSVGSDTFSKIRLDHRGLPTVSKVGLVSAMSYGEPKLVTATEVFAERDKRRIIEAFASVTRDYIQQIETGEWKIPPVMGYEMCSGGSGFRCGLYEQCEFGANFGRVAMEV